MSLYGSRFFINRNTHMITGKITIKNLIAEDFKGIIWEVMWNGFSGMIKTLSNPLAKQINGNASSMDILGDIAFELFVGIIILVVVAYYFTDNIFKKEPEKCAFIKKSIYNRENK